MEEWVHDANGKQNITIDLAFLIRLICHPNFMKLGKELMHKAQTPLFLRKYNRMYRKHVNRNNPEGKENQNNSQMFAR